MTGEQLYNLIYKASCELGIHRVESIDIHRPGIVQWLDLAERVRQAYDKAAENLLHTDSVVNVKLKKADIKTGGKIEFLFNPDCV